MSDIKLLFKMIGNQYHTSGGPKEDNKSSSDARGAIDANNGVLGGGSVASLSVSGSTGESITKYIA